MGTAMIAAIAAVALIGVQAPISSMTGSAFATQANADALDRYEGGATVQRNASPQRPGPFAAEQTDVDNGAFRQAAAEQTDVDNGAFRQAQAEQTGVTNTPVV